MKGKLLSKKRHLLSVVTTLMFLLFAQGATAINYTVIAGDRNDDSGEGLAKLFDGDHGTKWGNGFSQGNPQYVIFKVDAAVAPEWYCLVTGTDNAVWTDRGWKTWSIYGTNADIEAIEDNAAKRWSEEWALLDKKENILQDVMPDKNSFEVFFSMEKPSEAYTYFKIEIEEMVSGDGYMQMSEFYFGDDAIFKNIRSSRYTEYGDFLFPEHYTKPLGTNYTTISRSLRLAKNIFDVYDYSNQLDELQKQIQVSAEAYEAYKNAVATVKDAADKNNLTAEGTAKVQDYVANTYPGILDKGELDADAIKAETATVSSWIELYSNKDLTEGAIEGVTYEALSGRDGFNGEPFSALVDGNDGTKWCSNQGDYFIVIKASQAIVPTFYRLFTSNDTGNNPGRNWKTWQIYGANFDSDEAATREADGWTLLDDKQNSDVLPAKSNTEVFVNMTNPSETPYQYFKVEIKDPNGLMQMSEISFFNQANFYKSRKEKVDEFEAVDLSAPLLESVISEFQATLEELRHVATLPDLTNVGNKCADLANKIKNATEAYAKTGIVVIDGNTAWGDGENWTKLVDGDLTTKWGGGRPGDGSYVIFRVEAGAAPYFYTLVTGNDTGRSPDRNWADWTISAANFASDAEATRDAAGWVEIAKEEGIGQDRLPGANFAEANFDFAATPVAESYKYFLVQVTKSYDNGGNIQMTELIFKSAEEFAALKTATLDELKAKLTEFGADPESFIANNPQAAAAIAAINDTKTVAELLAIKAAADDFLKTLDIPEMQDGYYQIGTAEELAWLANAVNVLGFTKAKAKLTADLDMGGKLVDGAPAEDSPLFTPIGTTETPFVGEFDGQGHVISNLVINTGKDFTGLFGRIADGAVIKNFVVDAGSYIAGNSYVGVIGASLGGGTILIDRIGMEGKVVAAGINAGGIYACNMGGSANATLSNCYVTGDVISLEANAESRGQSAQINGWLGGGKIENTWAIGAIEGVYNRVEGAGDGFYRGAPTVGGVLYSNALYRNSTTQPFVEEDAKSGKMTYALNGNKADGAWYQTLGEDDLPTLNATHKKVYAVPSEGFRCDGLPLGEIVYTNEEQTPEIPAHEYEGYICKNCGQLNPNFVTPEDGVYPLSNVTEMAWFAAMVNSGNNSFSAKLTNDIDMEGALDGEGNPTTLSPFEPIGKSGNPFTGTFDGQGYTIKNLVINTGADNTGLIGVISGNAVVKNFIVDANSYIGGNAFVGIIGISNAGGNMIIDRIGMEGRVVAAAQNAGGIYGCNSGNPPVTITNCYVTGPVKGARESGQFNGWLRGGTIKNCWASGTIEGIYNKTEGAGDGFYRGPNDYIVSENNYSNCIYRNAPVNELTDEMLASGELTWLLNGGKEDGVWFQTLGIDAHPVLDSTHGVVYKVGDSYSNSKASILLVDGVYQIFAADGLVQYGNIVSGGEADAKAVLMADVDMSGIDFTPIGNKANLYTGTFDGQGHVINNLTVTKGVDADGSMGGVTDGYIGLFGAVTGGATIKNFTVKNAKLSGSAFIGVIGGSYGSGLITVDAVGFEGEAIGEQQNVSGIIGVNMGSSASFKISNSYVTGKIAGGRESAAITGWTGGSQSSITNSWSTAEVSGNDAGKPFYRNDDTVIENCYNLDGQTGNNGNKVNLIPEGSLADGSMTFLLNGNKADGVWYQTLGVDEYPVLTPTSKKVYAVPSEGFRCDGQPLGEIVYTNEEQTPEIPAHEYEGFICKNCGHINPDFVQPEDGVYSLSTADQLAWFAKKVNTGDKALNAVLTADIDMSAYPTTEYTIGLNNNGYAGTFDGQFHTVKVAYVNNADGGTEVNHSTALFRFVNGGTIKNIITTGTIDSNQKFASGLVGKSQGAGATMENVATYITINSGVNGDGTHAGFLGVADAPATITNAISAIVINGESTNSCGGLSGWASQPVTFNNCLMIGEINCQDSGSATFSRNPGSNTYTNCYYKEGVKELQDNGKATKVTADQLASGEVCYLLNGDQSEKVFFQTLGEDAYPVLDSTHGVVYKVGDTYSNSESLPTNLPLMSTADAIYVYTIKNCRSGKYVSYAGDDTNMPQTPEMTENSYFYFVADGETVGKFTPVKIYNVSAGKAMDDFASWGLGTTWYLMRDLGIYTNGLALGQSMNAGAGTWWNDYYQEQIGGWNANGDTGSVFVIEPVDAPEGLVTYTVDYKVDGKVAYTALVATTNAEFVPAAPLYSTIASTEVDGTKVTANVEVNTPFKASTEDAPVWYYLKQREIENYKHYPFFTDAEANMASEFYGAKSMFAFVGDPFNGYDIINYAAGKGKYWVIEGEPGNGSTPVWSETPRKWELAKKDDTYFGFGVNGFWMNNWGGGDSKTLKLWQSGPTSDNGSTLSVEAVPAEDLAAVEVGFDWDPAPIELTGDYEIVSSLSTINGTSTTGAINLVGTPKVTVKNFNTNEEISATIKATGNVLTLSLSKAITEHAVVYITIPAGSIASEWGNTNSKAINLTYFVGYNSKEEADKDAKLYLTDGIEGIMANGNGVDVFSLSGAQMKKNASASDLKSLKGVYIVNGKKVLLK